MIVSYTKYSQKDSSYILNEVQEEVRKLLNKYKLPFLELDDACQDVFSEFSKYFNKEKKDISQKEFVKIVNRVRTKYIRQNKKDKRSYVSIEKDEHSHRNFIERSNTKAFQNKKVHSRPEKHCLTANLTPEQASLIVWYFYKYAPYDFKMLANNFRYAASGAVKKAKIRECKPKLKELLYNQVKINQIPETIFGGARFACIASFKPMLADSIKRKEIINTIVLNYFNFKHIECITKSGMKLFFDLNTSPSVDLIKKDIQEKGFTIKELKEITGIENPIKIIRRGRNIGISEKEKKIQYKELENSGFLDMEIAILTQTDL